MIGLATSGWLMIDIRKRRPLRPESYPEWREHIHPERTIGHTFGRLPALDSQGDSQMDFRVRFSDVDVNGHANYLSYIDWILETIPSETRDGRQIAEFEVHFLREVNFEEELVSRAQPIGEGKIFPTGQSALPAPEGTQFLHSLIHKADGVELARARTVWKPLVD
jgi:acyl-ACP thioesterase